MSSPTEFALEAIVERTRAANGTTYGLAIEHLYVELGVLYQRSRETGRLFAAAPAETLGAHQPDPDTLWHILLRDAASTVRTVMSMLPMVLLSVVLLAILLLTGGVAHEVVMMHDDVHTLVDYMIRWGFV